MPKRKPTPAGPEPAETATRNLVLHLPPAASAGVRALTKAFGLSQEKILSRLSSEIGWKSLLSLLMDELEAEQRAGLATLFSPEPAIAHPPQEGEPDA